MFHLHQLVGEGPNVLHLRMHGVWGRGAVVAGSRWIVLTPRRHRSVVCSKRGKEGEGVRVSGPNTRTQQAHLRGVHGCVQEQEQEQEQGQELQVETVSTLEPLPARLVSLMERAPVIFSCAASPRHGQRTAAGLTEAAPAALASPHASRRVL